MPRPPRPRPPVPETPPGFLTTQELRERGWTLTLIRDYLGPHDGERPNGLRMGRRRLPPVKLYRQERVDAAESEERFLVAQARSAEARERSARAREVKAARRAAMLEELAQAWTPPLQVTAVRRGALGGARKPYRAAQDAELKRLLATLEQATPHDHRLLKLALAERLDTLLAQVYPWFPAPGVARPDTSDWN